MKRIRALGTVMLVLAILGLCSGCGRMTAEKLAVRTAAALAKTPITSQKTELEVEAEVGTLGVSLDLELSMVMDMVMAAEPYRAGVDAQVGMNVLGRDITQTMQIYLHLMEDSLVTYTHYDTLDIWQKTVRTFSPEEMLPGGSYEWLKAAPQELTLAEETRTIGGHETYVLSCRVNGARLQSILSAAGSDTDVSALEVPVVLYIDMETYLPVRMELEVQGMNDLLPGLLDPVFGQLTSLGLEMEMGTIHIACSGFGYDAVEVPTVPQEALDAETV